MKTILFFLVLVLAAIAEEPKIAVQNAILAKVNGTTISMLDVKKKMDLFFHQNYSHLADSTQARFQFYETSWHQMLMEMIDHQLILADATEKEVKLSDGEIREEMEMRFGPNIMLTLDKIGLSYDEAWKMVKEELIVSRMNWWFIHSKALAQVTPQDIRHTYRLYLEENPSYQEWKYRIISMRGENAEAIAKKAYSLLTASENSPECLADALKAIDPSIQVSSEYTATDRELSKTHQAALAPLSPTQYSQPLLQTSRSDKQPIARIFYLSQKSDHPAPSFEQISTTLRQELLQKAAAQESTSYLAKLHKHYGYDDSYLNAMIPSDFHPFSLE